MWYQPGRTTPSVAAGVFEFGGMDLLRDSLFLHHVKRSGPKVPCRWIRILSFATMGDYVISRLKDENYESADLDQIFTVIIAQ